MKEIKQSFHIITDIDGEEMLQRLERAGRTCYKSEAKITPDSSRKLIRAIIKRGHESVLEHETVSVRIICDRGVSHELVRHRIASYSQESTRYVNYGDQDIQFVNPLLVENTAEYKLWVEQMMHSEWTYKAMLNSGCTPQVARSVLPNSLKTELVMTTNLRAWRNFFQLRVAAGAHPQMRELVIPMLAAFKELIPVIFEDIQQ